MRPKTIILSIALLLAACGSGDTSTSGNDSESGLTTSSDGAAYAQRLIFLPPDPRMTAGVLFDFAVRADETSVHRAMQAWLVREGQWSALGSDRWQAPAMRAPWRLVPHGPLRVITGRDGELGALLFERPGAPLRIGATTSVGEWNPAANVYVRLRDAGLGSVDIPIQGTLVNVRFNLGPTTDVALEPIRREAYLTNGRGMFLVLFAGSQSTTGWLHDGARDRSWDQLRFVPSSYQSPNESGTAASGTADTVAARVPTAWTDRKSVV